VDRVLGYFSSLLAENNIHPIRGVRTLNNTSGGRCWRGVKKVLVGEHRCRRGR